MKTTEQARLELFEAWWITLASKWPDKSTRTAAWQGFNAALDAVVIELPDSHEAMKAVFDYQHGPSNKNVTGTTNWAANVGMTVVNECRTAIESTGLGLKVK